MPALISPIYLLSLLIMLPASTALFLCIAGNLAAAFILVRPSFLKTKAVKIQKAAAEEKIRESEKKYHSLFEQASDAIMVTDFSGNFKDVNSSLCKMFGYTKAELLQMNINSLIDADQLKAVPIRFPAIKEGQQIFSRRKMLHRDGTIVEVEANVKKFDDNSVVAIARDVTELRKAERQVEISEARFRSAFESSAIGMALVSLKGEWIKVNRELCRIVGYSEEELLTLNFQQITYHDDLEKDVLFLEKANLGELDNYSIEKRYIHKSGSIVWVNLNVSIVKDSSSNPLYFVSQIENITERKKAQEEIKNRESQLMAFFENVEGYASLVDTEKKLVIFNHGFIGAHRFFSNRDPVVGEEVYHFLPPEVRKDRYAVLDKVLKGNKEVIEVDYLIDGRRIFFRSSFNPVITDGKVTGISVYSIDLTKSKEAEMAVREAELKFRSLVEKSLVGVYILQDGKYAYVNPRFAEIFGYTQNEIIGATIEIIVEETEREKVAANINARLSGEKDSVFYESIGISKNGVHINFEVYGTVTQFQGRPAIIGSLIDITERRKAQAALKEMEIKLEDERIKKQQEITNAVITAQEKERQQLGSELHDNVNQMLASSRLYLGLAGNGAEENKNFIKEADKLIDAVIDEIRDLSHTLVAPSLDHSKLTEALDNIVKQTMQSTSINISTSWNGFNEDLVSEKLKLNIYRIVQEQFANILKHAHASEITLKLNHQNQIVVLNIKDNGTGFDTTQKPAGVGLVNIRTRASLFNGEVNIISSPGNGCELVVSFHAEKKQ